MMKDFVSCISARTIMPHSPCATPRQSTLPCILQNISGSSMGRLNTKLENSTEELGQLHQQVDR